MFQSIRRFTSIATAVRASPNRVAVLYGSHSGNTERYAKSLHSELGWRLGLNASISSLSALDFSDFSKLTISDTVILLLSTYGEGEPNPATEKFWECIFNAKNSPPFHFSVFSRGSSLYDTTFARAGIRIDSQLLRIGAQRLAPCGIQDKTFPHNQDQYFEWKEDVVKGLVAKYDLVEKPFKYVPSTSVEPVSTQSNLVPIIPNLIDGARKVKLECRELQKTDRIYLHAQLYLPGYKTGDYVTIWPSNSPASVDKFLNSVFGSTNQSSSLRVSLDTTSVDTSYELLAKHTIDINGQPERELMLKLADMAPSKLAQQRVKRLTEIQFTGSLNDMLAQTSPEAPWIKNLPPSAFLDMLPQLQPRRYSVASSSVETPDWAAITAVVERDPQTDFWGLATGQLYASRDTDAEIMAVSEPVRGFRLPEDPKIPLILVGVGTGVAPFRGFIRERALQTESGPIVMFSGTRTPEDLIHHDEFKQMGNVNLIPAYSRISSDDANYGYFTEKLEQNADLVYDLICKGAHIYVCGDVRKIRRGVRNTVAQILADKMGLTPKEGQKQWKALKTDGRLHIELW